MATLKNHDKICSGVPLLERGLLDAAAAASLLLGGLFGSWLRVALGYHSMDQVAAGTLAGSCGEVLSSTSSDHGSLCYLVRHDKRGSWVGMD